MEQADRQGLVFITIFCIPPFAVEERKGDITDFQILKLEISKHFQLKKYPRTLIFGWLLNWRAPCPRMTCGSDEAPPRCPGQTGKSQRKSD